MTSWLSDTSANKVVKTYVNGFMDCSGYFLNRVGNVMIGNTDYPGYNVNQRSLLVNGRTQMNGNLTINGNISVNSTNIALGFQAGNIINGDQSGLPNGLNSTAVGSYSGMNHTGTNNTFIGSVAGQATSTSYFSRTGTNNTYVGYAAQANGNYSNSTAIGTGAVITASNQIVLGTTNETVSIPGSLAPFAKENFTNMLSVTTSGKLVSRYYRSYNFSASGSGAAQMPLPFSSYVSTTAGIYIVNMRGGGGNGTYTFFVCYGASGLGFGSNIGITSSDGYSAYPSFSGGYLRWEYRSLPSSIWPVNVEILPVLGY
jgi:hypothetical protein